MLPFMIVLALYFWRRRAEVDPIAWTLVGINNSNNPVAGITPDKQQG